MSCVIKQTLKLLKIVHSFEWNKEIGEHVLVSEEFKINIPWTVRTLYRILNTMYWIQNFVAVYSL